MVGADDSDIVEDRGDEFIVGVKESRKQFCDSNNPVEHLYFTGAPTIILSNLLESNLKEELQESVKSPQKSESNKPGSLSKQERLA